MSWNLRRFVSEPRVSDGAWGTELQKRGLGPGASPEFLNVEDPDAVLAVAKSYVDAGADCIITNSFGGNRFILGNHGLADRLAELNVAAAKISRQAVEGTEVRVLGSLGPSGKLVMLQETPQEEIRDAFAEAAEALVSGGVDGLLLETFNELDELIVALQGARSVTDLPIVGSMTFSSGPEQTASMMGDQPADAARRIAENGGSSVGANCGVGPGNYVRVTRLLREATDLPIWVKANAGVPRVDASGRTYFPMGPEEFGAHAPDLAAAGADIIGGCCGTTPEHIRAVRDAL